MRTLIIIGLLAAPALADTINVDPLMSTADINTAIAGAADGDVVKFAKGVYLLDDSIQVDVDGVTLDGGGKAVLDAQYQFPVVLVRADRVTIEKLEIVHGGTDAEGVNPGEGRGIWVDEFGAEGTVPQGTVITKNRIGACEAQGVYIVGRNVTITKNRIDGNGNDGIQYFDGMVEMEGGGSTTTVISGNNIQFNGDKGIEVDLDGPGERMIIEKNLCATNSSEGMDIDLRQELPGEGEKKGPEPSLIARNKCIGNGDHGIQANDEMGRGLVIEKNTCTANGSDGIDVFGLGVVVDKNKTDFNLDEGIQAFGDGMVITKNKAQNNRRWGLDVGGSVTEGLGTVLVSGNTAKGNGKDGFAIFSSGTQVIKNRSQRNFGDGMDIWPGYVGILLESNSIKNNNHEGIDNGSAFTDMIKNKVKGSGFGGGIDIAGTGDGGGSVDTFDGNSFDTGGPFTPAAADNN